MELVIIQIKIVHAAKRSCSSNCSVPFVFIPDINPNNLNIFHRKHDSKQITSVHLWSGVLNVYYVRLVFDIV